ncbi:hypothetical protein ACFL6I_09580 [candidate division KSB1 bacterium]
MDKEKKKEIFWVFGIFAFLLIGLGVILEMDLWVPIQNVVQLEVVWLLSAIFIVSFIIMAVMLHHDKVVMGKKKSILHEFEEMSRFGKISLLIFVSTIALMIVALVLTKTGHINFTKFEIEEEWIIIILAMVSYVAIIIEMMKTKEGK